MPVNLINCPYRINGYNAVYYNYQSYLVAVSCVNLPTGMEPTVHNVCTGLNANQQLITLFSENYVPVNCRSSLEGVWQFAYQVRREIIFHPH